MPRFEYTPARRENTNVLISLAGASGSGKTYSAMLLASGICGNEPFAVVDTEARRALHYADQFDFEHTELGPPFTPDRYLEAIRPLAKRGFRTILVDSASHEWEGEGGLLEMAAAQAKKKKGPAAWEEPKRLHRKMLGALMQMGTNLIFCLRAHDKIEIDTSGPRTKVIDIGWKPICERRFPFEMTVSFTFDPTNPGIVDLTLPHKLQDQHRHAFLPGKHIGRRAGEIIGAWARGETIETPDKELWDAARRAAAGGWTSLKAYYLDLPEGDRAKLRPIETEVKAAARRVDRETKEWQRDLGDVEG